MDKKIIKVVCGFSNERSASIRETLTEAAAKKNIELYFICRYRKEGVLQFVREHADYNIVVLQEILQNSSPYTAEDLSELKDVRELNVIVSLNKNHYGDRYMRILYTAGIMNALYEEDASAEKIVDLMISVRNRKECRGYYGIKTLNDLEQTLNIIDQMKVTKYSDYIINGGSVDDISSRYIFSADMLNSAENIELVRILPTYIKNELADIELYSRYFDLSNGKRRWFKKSTHLKLGNRKNKEQNKSIDTEINTVEEAPDEIDPGEGQQEIATESQPQIMEAEFEAGELLEEDISDLLGFSGGHGQSPLLEKQKDVISGSSGHPTGSEILIPRKKMKKGFTIIICLFASILILFLVCLLILGPLRHKETDLPVIKQESSDTNRQTQQKEVPTSEADKNRKEPGDKKKAQEPKQTDVETEKVLAETSVADKNEEPKPIPSTPLPENERQGDNQAIPIQHSEGNTAPAEEAANPVASQPDPPQENGQGEGSDVTVETNDNNQEAAPSEPQATPPDLTDNYNGKIFSGDEVAGIAQMAENEGKAIYVKTRNNGEGFFSAAQVNGSIENSCSYLANVDPNQITFIEQ